ncbi:M28 family peptidase, partial [Thermodesulfobacteriota bacterium]
MDKHVYWLEKKEKELEKKVLTEYSTEEVRKHLEYLATLIRHAGTDDELKAATYIMEKLDEFGIKAKLFEIDDAYISYPGKAEFEIFSPLQKSFPCLTHSFSASTPPDGIEAELIWLGKGSEEDYQDVDAKGKIVLVEPGRAAAQVEAAEIAEKNEAVAQIHISVENPKAISVNRFGRTWGNPNLETMNKVPRTPAISICNDDGKYLAALTQKGPVVAGIKADVWSGYKKIRCPMGVIPGTKEPEKYMLFATHYCSWFTGVTDNATANAMMLETARILSKYRKNLGRSVKLAWWSGHSQGRAACSTWYLENFWDDLRDNAVAYVVTDAIGRIGSSGFSTRNTEEIRKFHEKVVKDVLGLERKSTRVTKTGDQCLWGLGIPSMAGSTQTPGGKAWFTHTVDDTLDKVDMELIKIPFKVIATSILRICNNPVLPFDFVAVADAFLEGLNELQEDGGGDLDLTSLTTQAKALKHKAEALNNG